MACLDFSSCGKPLSDWELGQLFKIPSAPRLKVIWFLWSFWEINWWQFYSNFWGWLFTIALPSLRCQAIQRLAVSFGTWSTEGTHIKNFTFYICSWKSSLVGNAAQPFFIYLLRFLSCLPQPKQALPKMAHNNTTKH